MAKRKVRTDHLPLANKDLFLQRSAQSLKREKVDVEEMGVSVLVQELSGRKLVICQEAREKITDKPNSELEFMALVVSLGVVNEDGTDMFTQEEAMRLIDGSIEVLKLLATKTMLLSGFGEFFEEVKSDLKNDLNSSSSAS